MKKTNIQYGDFEKLDLRVGEITNAVLMENSKKLIVFTVDLGEDYGTVEILSGIAKWYTPESFIGKKYPFVANLEPKKMGNTFSNGMMFMADGPQEPILIELSNTIPNGTVIR